MEREIDCKCTKIEGHLEDVNWLLWPRAYEPSPGLLALGDWTKSPYIWLNYVESLDGLFPNDNVLISTDPRYWSIHDAQRYFTGLMHCELAYFTYQYPNLRMPTLLGKDFWKANTAMKVTPQTYQKEFGLSLEVTLKKMEANQDQMDRLIISDQLIKIDRLDVFKRRTFFRILLNIIRYQTYFGALYISSIGPQIKRIGEHHGNTDAGKEFLAGTLPRTLLHSNQMLVISFQKRLQLVSLENLCCKRLEGVRLIQQLACFASDTLKYLFLWRFVLPNENPILINYSYITGSGQFIPRPESAQCFLRSLGQLTALRVLALEYGHVADGTGRALITLLPIMKKPHFRLQLICREEHIPGRTDAALGAGGHDIPDTAWRRVTTACPDLYVFMAFCRVRDYDNVRRFLTPSVPLREAHLQLGVDLHRRQRQDSDVSCFVRHMAYHYGNSLGTLSIHQWRFAVFPLRRVLELMPGLSRFLYVGRVQDEVDLRRMLHIVAGGVCDKLKQLRIQVQDEETKGDYWQKVVENLNEEFKDIMKMLDIQFCLSLYKS